MGQTLAEKILSDHLVEGDPTPGEEIGIEIDQVLVQDTTGAMVWLQFRAPDLDGAQTELTVQYYDHQTYQFDFKNTDDRRFFRFAAGTYGAHFSRPGSGIYRNVHKENFAAPGRTLLGSDSHTPTPGGPGQFAVGTGDFDITVAMGGGTYYVEMSKVVNVHLEDELPKWSSAKDVILKMLRRETVKGDVGKVFKYTGPDAESPTVSERTIITNMGTELGATSSLFGTDEKTRDYLERQGRDDGYIELTADDDAEYADEVITDLSELKPPVARLSIPDNVAPVHEAAGEKVEQVLVGSCTGGGYEDVLPAAKMVKDQGAAKHLEMIVVPGSEQTGEMLTREGWMAEMVAADVNVSETTCNPYISIGHVPTSDSVLLHTFNRNFEGRSGIEDDNVYLCSPQVATAAALKSEIVDPHDLAGELGLDVPGVELPDKYDGSKTGLTYVKDAIDDELIKDPNVDEAPLQDPLGSDIPGETLLKMEDNITVDHIIPTTSSIPEFRSNIERLSDFTFSRINETFAQRTEETGSDVLVAGENYGQGSSREHAAMCPMYLDIEAVLAWSFARIHKANLFNFDIVPLAIDEETCAKIEQGDSVEVVDDVAGAVESGQEEFTIRMSDDQEATTDLHASERERYILVAGGRLPLTKQQAEGDAAPADD